MAQKRQKGQSIQAGAETVVVRPMTFGEDFLRSLKGSLPGGANATHAVVVAEPGRGVVPGGRTPPRVDHRRRQQARAGHVTRVLGSIPLDVAKQAPCNVYIVHTTG